MLAPRSRVTAGNASGPPPAVTTFAPQLPFAAGRELATADASPPVLAHALATAAPAAHGGAAAGREPHIGAPCASRAMYDSVITMSSYAVAEAIHPAKPPSAGTVHQRAGGGLAVPVQPAEESAPCRMVYDPEDETDTPTNAQPGERDCASGQEITVSPGEAPAHDTASAPAAADTRMYSAPAVAQSSGPLAGPDAPSVHTGPGDDTQAHAASVTPGAPRLRGTLPSGRVSGQVAIPDVFWGCSDSDTDSESDGEIGAAPEADQPSGPSEVNVEQVTAKTTTRPEQTSRGDSAAGGRGALPAPRVSDYVDGLVVPVTLPVSSDDEGASPVQPRRKGAHLGDHGSDGSPPAWTSPPRKSIAEGGAPQAEANEPGAAVKDRLDGHVFGQARLLAVPVATGALLVGEESNALADKAAGGDAAALQASRTTEWRQVGGTTDGRATRGGGILHLEGSTSQGSSAASLPEAETPGLAAIMRKSSVGAGVSAAAAAAGKRINRGWWMKERRALQNLGFLMSPYKAQLFFWELCELGKKLLLSSLLAFVEPGTATQVTAGMLMTFAMVLGYALLAPFKEKSIQAMALWAQVGQFLYFLVALLLKVKVDNTDPEGPAFSGLVTSLSVSVPLAPLVIKFFLAGKEEQDYQEDQEGLQGGEIDAGLVGENLIGNRGR